MNQVNKRFQCEKSVMKNGLTLGQGKPKSFRKSGAFEITDFKSKGSNSAVLEKVFKVSRFSQPNCDKLLWRLCFN